MNKYRERYKEQGTEKLKEPVAKNDRENLMKTFKQFEDYDKECEECIFEHEHEPLQELSIKVKRSNLMTLFVVEVRSFTYM